MKRILLVEDELHVVGFITKGLAEEGYEISVALDGATGLGMAMADPYDLVILDIMLPDMNGLDVCKQIRTSGSTVPILFLTALSTAENVAHGLNVGADDYLVKPFKFIELHARVKALLRRMDTMVDARNATTDVYTLADLVVDDRAKTVKRGDVQIGLTATEYRLLLALIRSKGVVLSRMDLLESAWDINHSVGTNVVDVYINYLRKKLEKGNSVRLIHTVIGMGYVLREA